MGSALIPAGPVDPEIITHPSGVKTWRGPHPQFRERGQQTIYDPDIARHIIFKLSEGQTLLQACQDLGINRTTVNWWGMDNRRGPGDTEGFAARYARARFWGCYAINDECIEIADNGSNDWMRKNDPDNLGWAFNGEAAARTRLRLETRRFYLAKIAPKIFGDKLDLNVRPEGEIEASSPVQLDQLNSAQLQAIETAALACAAVGVRIKIVGLDKVSA